MLVRVVLATQKFIMIRTVGEEHMAARWMQQKKSKQRRMRRAWAKPFSMRNTGPHKHPGFLNEKGEFIDEGFKARALVAKSTIDQHLLRKFKFNPNSNEAIYARTQGLHTDLAYQEEGDSSS